eukprot:SM000078S22124  [mRNA]  locus=s78:521011:521388:+ [translate_table: standard]
MALTEVADLLTLDDIRKVLDNVRARDVEVIDVKPRCDWTDYMVIATGNSARHIRGMADALVYAYDPADQLASIF